MSPFFTLTSAPVSALVSTAQRDHRLAKRPSEGRRTATWVRLTRALSLLVIWSLLLPGCVMNTASPGVFLATNPPGARVFVDGKDTGFATPCAISLDKTREHEVAFLLDGYEVARRDLFPNTRWTTTSWADGDIGLSIWRFPLFLTFTGLFFPFSEDDDLVPSRVYIPLEIATEGI